MSLTLLSMALHAPLPPEQKLVLLALADFADGAGFAGPTLAKLADMTGYSSQDVQAALRALLAANIIISSPNGQSSIGKPSRYLISANALDRLSKRKAPA